MGSFWENERQIAAMQLAVTAGQAGRTIVNRWNSRVRAQQMELRVREAYKAALAAAKDTGNMPEEFQGLYIILCKRTIGRKLSPCPEPQ